MTMVGTHLTHCCKYHGCKYGENSSCPVAGGYMEPEYSTCGLGWELDEEELCSGEKEHVGTTIEWAFQTKTFVDGDFDRTYTTQNYRKLDEEMAREIVNNYNRSRPGIARVVKREVYDWKAAD